MKRVVLALLEDQIQAAVGSAGRSAKLRQLFRWPVELRGGNELTGWEEAIRALWAERQLPRRGVYLVLPGAASGVRSLSLPPMRESRLSRAVQDELQSREERELVTDYLPLERERSGARRVLACACPRDEFERYLAMMERLGLKLGGVTVPLGPVLNLLRSTREMLGKTCIWLCFDGDTLLSVLVEGGIYRYAGRNRIYSEPGTLDFAIEITRNVSGTLQFRAAERMNTPISDLYFAGCSDSDFEVCIPGVEDLGLQVFRLPECSRVRILPQGERLSDCLLCAGALLR